MSFRAACRGAWKNASGSCVQLMFIVVHCSPSFFLLFFVGVHCLVRGYLLDFGANYVEYFQSLLYMFCVGVVFARPMYNLYQFALSLSYDFPTCSKQSLFLCSRQRG